jgi:hypothetical protein
VTPEAGRAELAQVAHDAEHLDELRRVADDVLGREWSTARARAGLDDDATAWRPDLWSTVTGLGWVDLRHGVDDDDTVGEVELCVLAEALGAALAPVPLAAAAAAASLTGEDASGPLRILVEGPARIDVTTGGPVLSGSWPSVPFGAAADHFVVSATDGSGATRSLDVPAGLVARHDLRPLDRSPDASVAVDGLPLASVTVLDLGRGGAERRRRAERTVLLGRVAELVGVADRANEAAVAYAKERVAFGHPIGTFQAVKHRLVDQRAAVEVARALVGRAARASQDGRPDADALASLAAFWAGGKLRAVAEGAVQVFGGVGYTWDHDAHVYLRRAACLCAALGPRRRHRVGSTRWLVERSRRDRSH